METLRLAVTNGDTVFFTLGDARPEPWSKGVHWVQNHQLDALKQTFSTQLGNHGDDVGAAADAERRDGLRVLDEEEPDGGDPGEAQGQGDGARRDTGGLHQIR